MNTLPTGTVTFLFTDIEGSTKLAQSYADRWEALRARHHAILKSAIESNGGYIFQIIGDAFCASFHTAGDAVRAAARSQIDLHNEDWRVASVKVRMGINTGTAQASIDLDHSGGYTGYRAMARVQRLMSAGHGGQVLISATTQELLRDDLPDHVSLRDMGEKRLKDLNHPEHIYQLVLADLPLEFPPLKTLDAYRHNLPVQLTSFIGRENEMAEITRSIMIHRLVTLTGVGGTGKTRLALQVAANMLDQFPDGVWFVQLAAIDNPVLIPQMILSALGIPEQGGMTIQQLLMDHLRGKHMLLILDNCEHVIEASAKLAESLLGHAPELRIMTTGREALGVNGELVRQVPSLSLPNVKRFPAIEQFSQFEAVQLFIERALLVQPDFEVTNDNAPYVAQICSRLDGIPLAIELAAARVRVLSVDQISERLDDRFRLLTGGNRTALERHQTLQAALDWSYNLLSSDEQILLCRLSIFAGSWSLEAAEQVCGEGRSDFDVLDLLTRLIEKSLVLLDGQRYRMLGITRQYSLDKLTELSGLERAQEKHLAYFLRFAENAENHLIGADQAEWLNHLEREYDNLRSALKWSMQAGRGEDGLRIAGALGNFWTKHCHYSEGRNWIRNILESNWSVSDQVQVKAYRFAGASAVWQGDLAEARRIFTRNLEREESLGDQWGIAFSLHMLGIIENLEGNLEVGRKMLKKSIALSRRSEATWVLALAMVGLGYLEQSQGNLDLAEELYEESLFHCRRLGEKWGMGLILNNLGLMSCSKGDFPAAKKLFLENLNLTRELGDKLGMLGSFVGLAGIYQYEGRQTQSARLQGAVARWGKEFGISMESVEPVEQKYFDSTAESLKVSMGGDAYQAEFETGKQMSLEETIEYALRELK